MTVHERAVGHGIHEAGHAIRHAVDSLHREGLTVVRIASKRYLTLPAAVLLGFLAGNSPGVISSAEAQAANRLPPSGTVEPAKGSPTLGISVVGLPDSPLPPASSGEPPPRPDTGVSGVLLDQPSQPAEEGPVEGGEGGGVGGNGTSGEGAVEPPVSESTPEPQVARPPIVRRTEVSRELVEEYPEQSDGTTVYVKKYEVTFSDGQTEFAYVVPPPVGSPPPPPPPAAAPPRQQETPPPASGEQTADRARQIEASSYTDRGPNRKKFRPGSKGEGIYDSPEFVDPPEKYIYGYVVKTVRLPNRHLGIIVRVHGQEFKLEYITKDVADSVKKPKEVRPTVMFFQNQSAGTTKAVKTQQLSDAENRLERDDAVWVSITDSWFNGTIHGFGAPVRAIWFTGS